MDISSLLPQLGISAIFVFASYKLYNDMRQDSREREDKLMAHLEKVADTLEKIDERLSKLEENQRG